MREALFDLAPPKPSERMFSLRPATHWSALRNASFRSGAAQTPPGTIVSQPFRRSARRLRGAHGETVATLLAASEARDPQSEPHAYRVAALAERLGGRMGLLPADLSALVTAALVHDIGKLGIPDAILAKPGPLTRAEYATIQRHPVIGESILRPLAHFEQVRSLVRHHHEWYDGNGYPDGLAGERIPLGARILHVADSIDAMLTPRPYKDGRAIGEVIDELIRCRGTQFDPVIADIAVSCLRRGPNELPSRTGVERDLLCHV